MAWVKGQSGNPKGRPTTTAISELREILARKNRNLLGEALETLDLIEDPAIKLNYLFKFLDLLYSKPKESDVSLEQAIEVVKSYVRERRESGSDDSGNRESKEGAI